MTNELLGPLPIDSGIVIFLISFAITILVTPRLSQIAPRMGLVDYPDDRKIHTTPTPLIGGLAIVIAFIVSSFMFIPLESLYGFFIGFVILFVAGLIDDARDLNPYLKFVVQFLSVSLMIYFSNKVIYNIGDLIGIGEITLGIISIPFTIFCVVGVVNAVNMLDGLDGLAGGVSSIALISFAILAYINGQMELMLLSIALLSAVIGFLRYNWYPAKLFMGDSGSLSIGFALAFIAIALTQKANSHVSPIVPLLILAVPITDTITLMAKRITRCQNPFRPDKRHLHHNLLKLGLNKEESVNFILLVSATFSLIGILGTIFKIADYYLFIIFILFFIVYFVFSFNFEIIYNFISNIRLSGKGVLEKIAYSIYLMDSVFKIRRKERRYYLDLPFTVIRDGNSQILSGSLINISAGGLSTKLNDLLSKGEKLKVSIALPDPKNGKSKPVTATAVVVWAVKEDNNHYRYGLRFLNTSKNKCRILRRSLAMCI